MKRIAELIIAAAVAAACAHGANQDAAAEKQLEAAFHKETVQGDLKGAMEQYRRIAAQFAKQPAVAARALYQLGQCQEKLGQAEARKSYERIVRDYASADQYAAQARARLAALTTPQIAASGMTYRQVWTGPKVDDEGTISPDGRYLSFVDWSTGDLALHDFVTNSDRLLTNKGPWSQSGEYAEYSVISKDGRQIAYAWFDGKARYHIRIASLPASGLVQPRKLFDDKDVVWIAPRDWSPDGKWLAVVAQRRDRSNHVALVSTVDGSMRVLKPSSGMVTGMFFSPDGKRLGFDLVSDPRSDRQERDIYVRSIEGTEETKAVAGPSRDIMMGWSPDGKLLLFASDRTGTMGLWAIATKDGVPEGAPWLLKPEVAQDSLGITAKGALYLGVELSDRDIHIASLDFRTGALLSPPRRPIQTFIGFNSLPDWSPDGKRLAYVSDRNRAGTDRILAVRSMETGEVQELRPNLKMIGWPRWAPDGLSILTNGVDLNNTRGIYRIDLRNGETTRIVELPADLRRLIPHWSPVGDRVYYIRGEGDKSELVERSLPAGSERVLLRRQFMGMPSVSPDGKTIAAITFLPEDGTGVRHALVLVPVAGGEPRELLRDSGLNSNWRASLSWTPDGSGLIAKRWTGTVNLSEWWVIPVQGGAPRKLQLDFAHGFYPQDIMRVHPDGKQVAFVHGEMKREVFVLDNFLPARD